MASRTMRAEAPKATPAMVRLPAPTPQPIVLAFGVTLLFAGLVTSASVSILGAILFVTGCVGWFREVLPHEKEETVEVKSEAPVIFPSRHEVERLSVAPDLPRPLLPLEIYPVSAGIKGGLAGSVAMAVLACLYGLLKQGSIWYPINLLAATVYSQSLESQNGIAKRVSFQQFPDRCRHSYVHVSAGRTPVRNDAADFSTPANSLGRRCSTNSLDRITPQHLRAHQPAARRAH
jgi:hypothetical protein